MPGIGGECQRVVLRLFLGIQAPESGCESRSKDANL